MAEQTGRSGGTLKKAKQMKLSPTDPHCRKAASVHSHVSIPIAQGIGEEAASTGIPPAGS